MAILWYGATGALLALFPDARPGPTPPGQAGSLVWDDEDNPTLFDAINADWNNYHVVAGALQRAGVPVVIVGSTLTARQQALAQVALANLDGDGIVLRAIVLALLAQLNVLRAALPTPLPPITAAQA